ncbi:hypothetical protein OG21DRAFT_1523237 [Imleria badia]|nr:hypothetical protein OG21DRAFT_1523237 [Imleria badia]
MWGPGVASRFRTLDILGRRFDQNPGMVLGVLEGSVLFALSGYCPPALGRPLLAILPAHSPRTPPNSPPPFSPAPFSPSQAPSSVQCFRTLGKDFTFELGIRPAQTLVTDGVYGVVRYSGYTGFITCMVGYLFCVFDRHGPVVSVWARLLEAGIGRMDKEDVMLEKNFAEEWRAWAKRVPYRLIPGGQPTPSVAPFWIENTFVKGTGFFHLPTPPDASANGTREKSNAREPLPLVTHIDNRFSENENRTE